MNTSTQPGRRGHRLPSGATVSSDRVRFRIWAPGQKRVRVEVDGLTQGREMTAREASWFELMASDARAGDRYRFVLDDGSKIPDPASRYQPHDVHGASEVIDPFSYQWQVSTWQGRPWEEAVVFELHLAALTPEGTYRAAVSKLDSLVEQGVTAIQVTPVADFPGGYDGVLLYAPDASYGRPEEFKGLIDAAHARGLMVLLDIEYDRFGPDGNYPAKLAPRTFTRAHDPLWARSIERDDADRRAAREFVIHNALYWIEEFNIDGLRLDAVRSAVGEGHLLHELAQRVRAATAGRFVHLIVENEPYGMVDKGVDSKRLWAFGRGQGLPVADNRGEQGRQQNRRAAAVVQSQARQLAVPATAPWSRHKRHLRRPAWPGARSARS